MTDNEIIKALECCVYGTSVCKKCYYNYSDDCQRTMMIDVLKLINCKDEKINGLIAGQETLQKHIAEKNAEIEKLNGSKSTSLKELAELVKLEFYKEFDELIPSIMADKIDNLVKELIEKNNFKE